MSHSTQSGFSAAFSEQGLLLPDHLSRQVGGRGFARKAAGFRVER